MTVTSEYISISTDVGKVQIVENVHHRLADVDSIIFDFDGVLVDVSRSVMQVHGRIATRYFTRLGWQNTERMVVDTDVELFKLAGGFNNDWDLAYAWCLFYWFKHIVTGYNDGDVLCVVEPSFEEYISHIAETGGGLDNAEEFIKHFSSDHEWLEVQKSCDRESILRLFKETYAGDLCSEIYGFSNETVKGKGFIWADQPILDSSMIPAETALGIATGRTAGEVNTGIKLMGWESFFPNNHVVSEDDGFLKPDHRILELSALKIGAVNPIYIGDTPDDLLTCDRYNGAGGNAISCMVTSGLRNPGIADIFMNQNADIVADNVNAALTIINRYIGGNHG
ncbi:MAG: HAD family hydrolase [Armatimonadota bacterium]